MSSPETFHSSVVPIFGTPFAVLHLAEANALNPLVSPVLATRIASQAATPAGESQRPCQSSRDDLFDWPEEPVRRLSGELLRAIWGLALSVNEFPESQLRTFTLHARAWATIVPPDGCVPATSYPLTSWCAIYCVQAPEPSPTRMDSGSLRLYESRFGTMFADPTNSAMRLPFRPGHYTWRPVPGQVAIFPASITHEIALVRAPSSLMLITVRARFAGPNQPDVGRW